MLPDPNASALRGRRRPDSPHLLCGRVLDVAQPTLDRDPQGRSPDPFRDARSRVHNCQRSVAQVMGLRARDAAPLRGRSGADSRVASHSDRRHVPRRAVRRSREWPAAGGIAGRGSSDQGLGAGRRMPPVARRPVPSWCLAAATFKQHVRWGRTFDLCIRIGSPSDGSLEQPEATASDDRRRPVVYFRFCCTSPRHVDSSAEASGQSRSGRSLEGTSGMKFPGLESPISPDRIQVAKYRVAGETEQIPTRRKRAKFLSMTIRSGKTGSRDRVAGEQAAIDRSEAG